MNPTNLRGLTVHLRTLTRVCSHYERTIIRDFLCLSMALQLQCVAYKLHFPTFVSHPQIYAASPSSSSTPTRTSLTRRAVSLFTITTFFSGVELSDGSGSNYSWSKPAVPDFAQLPNSGGVKALELRIGDGETPSDDDKV